MFCRNCGAPADEGAQFCIKCGANLTVEGAVGSEATPPPSAAEEETPVDPLNATPPPPGATPYPPPNAVPPPPPPPGYVPPPGVVPKQKLVAALLGIVLGWLGIHRFYLGYHTIGAIQLVLGVAGIFTCGLTTLAAWIWGVIDGVMILTGSIATDAQGIPLRD